MRNKILRKILTFVLIVGMVNPISFSLFSGTNITYAAEQSESLPADSEDGLILQAHMWSFQAIKNRIPDIAKAGFKVVQVSPVQKAKNGSEWWNCYQPLNQSIGNRLGTKEDFKELCTEAKKYDIAIIVDAVMNHMANQSDSQKDTWSNSVDSAFKRRDFYHNQGQCSHWENRYDSTQLGIGMPDLNTQNQEVQNKAIAFLNECIDAGADGFRFDAAKHIETNRGADANQHWAGDYWDNVLGSLHHKKSLFLYGEILDVPNSNADNYQAYAHYMSVTDHYYGEKLRNAVRGNCLKNAQNWTLSLPNDRRVSYVENHDDFEHNKSNITDFQRKICWGILASRANVTPMYLSRRLGQVGSEGSSDWNDQEIAAVNHFHNAMVNQSEYLRYPNDKCMMVDRGTKGLAIINEGDSFSINQSTNLKKGSYIDKGGSGAAFQVKNGKITGNVPAGRIIVLYDGKVNPITSTVTVSPKKPVIGENVTITYHAANRPLNGASNVNIYWSYDNWTKSGIQTTSMVSKGDNKWEVVLTVPSEAKNTIEFVFNDGNGRWDNNDASDWSITLS